MKRAFLTSIIFVTSISAAIVSFPADQATIQGAALPAQNIIFTGTSDSSNHHYGMAYYDSSLFMILYRTDQVTQVSLEDYSLVSGYPTALSSFGNHGIEIDVNDGSIWTGTANSVIKHHSAALGFLASKTFPYESTDEEYQPVNLIIYGDELYVADRKKDSIYVLNKTTLDINTSFPIMGMDSASAGGYVDLFVYSDRLYVVSDELDGITTMNLDGTGQEIIMIDGHSRLGAFGIYVRDDIIYLNGHTSIIITDLTGKVLDSWDIARPDGYYDNYIDMELVGDQMFIASGWDILYPPNCDTLDRPCGTLGSHILVYDVPQNFAPNLAAVEDATTMEDVEGKTVILSASDFDGDTLSYSAVSDTDAVSITILADTLLLTPSLNWNGIAQITAFVSDGFLADTIVFTLTVIPVNDLPETFSLLLPEDESIITDPEAGSQTFTWEPSNDVDGDDISYRLNFSSGEWDLSVSDIYTTSYQLDVKSFPRGMNILWFVVAADNDTSMASLDTNSIQILAVVPRQNIGSAYLHEQGRIRVLDGNSIHPEANPAAYVITGNTITVEAWVFPTHLPNEANSSATIVRRPILNEDPRQAYELLINNVDDSGEPRFQFTINGVSVTSDAPVVPGTWTHLAGTYDGNKLRLYVDGISAGEQAFEENISEGNTGLYIGGVIESYFHGLIDEVQLWNTARTPTEIQTDMSYMLHGDELGLVGLWSMDSTYYMDDLPVTPDLTASHNDLWVQRSATILDIPEGADVNIAPDHVFYDLATFVGDTLEQLIAINSGWPIPTVSLSSGPAGMKIDPATGVLSWTPSEGQWGYFEFTYQAINSAGNVSGSSRVWVDIVPQETVTLDISNADLTFASNGVMGFYDHSANNVGFTFNGVNGLYAGNVAIAVSDSQVSGGLYVEEFSPLTGINPVESDLPGFDQAFETTFWDKRADNPIEVTIVQRSHAKSTIPDDDYVIVEYKVNNHSGADLNGLYIGLSVDWDVGDPYNNLGGYDSERRLSYTYEADGTNNTNYYGIAALSHPVSGHSQTLSHGSNSSDMYNSMITFIDIPAVGSELRSILACGPFDIAEGENEQVAFAILGGENLNDLMFNAEQAQGMQVVSAEQSQVIPQEYMLRPNYPNPFNPTTTLSYELPEQSMVNLKVFDIRGQEIMTLQDDAKPPGVYEVQWNGVNQSGNPVSTGVYFVRLQAGDFSKTIKMLYLK